MNAKSIRKCLETNKIWFETVAAGLISIMAVIVSFSQCSVAERQYQSSIDPVLTVEVEDIGSGNNGVYKLKIINNGVLDICNIDIYENYLQCPFKKQGDHLAVDSKRYSISSVRTLPMRRLSSMAPGDEIPYTIDIKKHMVATSKGKQVPCYLRLRIDYKKKADGKPYKQLYAYIISNILMDLESDACRFMLRNEPHVSNVRDFLLNKY